MNPTGTEARVCELIAKRQELGCAKYGTTVAENPLSLLQWMRHHLEELLDAAVYVQRQIELIEGVPLQKQEVQEAPAQNGINGHPQELIDSWKPGELWQFTNIDGKWRDCLGAPHWREGVQYRKKPDEPADPHAELKKTYKPGQGQRWQWACFNGVEWSDWDDCIGSPMWKKEHKYRRYPDDKDQE